MTFAIDLSDVNLSCTIKKNTNDKALTMNLQSIKPLIPNPAFMM